MCALLLLLQLLVAVATADSTCSAQLRAAARRSNDTSNFEMQLRLDMDINSQEDCSELADLSTTVGFSDASIASISTSTWQSELIGSSGGVVYSSEMHILILDLDTTSTVASSLRDSLQEAAWRDVGVQVHLQTAPSPGDSDDTLAPIGDHIDQIWMWDPGNRASRSDVASRVTEWYLNRDSAARPLDLVVDTRMLTDLSASPVNTQLIETYLNNLVWRGGGLVLLTDGLYGGSDHGVEQVLGALGVSNTFASSRNATTQDTSCVRLNRRNAVFYHGHEIGTTEDWATASCAACDVTDLGYTKCVWVDVTAKETTEAPEGEFVVSSGQSVSLRAVAFYRNGLAAISSTLPKQLAGAGVGQNTDTWCTDRDLSQQGHNADRVLFVILDSKYTSYGTRIANHVATLTSSMTTVTLLNDNSTQQWSFVPADLVAGFDQVWLYDLQSEGDFDPVGGYYDPLPDLAEWYLAKAAPRAPGT
ncbi:MAG: hypothetical protein MHM6MM_008026 [Cercozoa sp. M6MM]